MAEAVYRHTNIIAADWEGLSRFRSKIVATHSIARIIVQSRTQNIPCNFMFLCLESIHA